MKEQDLPEPFSGTICAAGGLILRHHQKREQILVVHRPHYDDWSLPKGKLDPDESWPDAALREVLEETGLVCDLIGFETAIQYHHNEKPKVVAYYRMRCTTENPFTPNSEVDQILWLDLAEAIEKLSYTTEQKLLRSISRG